MTHITEERLVAYALDDTAPDERAAIDAHLEQCTACSDARDELGRVLDAAGSIEVPARGSDYGARVWGRIEPLLPAPPRQRPRFHVPAWFAAGAVLLIAVSAFVIGRWSGASSVPGSEPSVSSPALDTHAIRERVVLTELVETHTYVTSSPSNTLRSNTRAPYPRWTMPRG